MAYQIHLTGQEIDERLQNVGTAEDAAAADGTLYARIKKNADDIAENKENVKVLIKRVDVVTGTANSAEALAKANEKNITSVTGTANTAKELAQKNQFNLGQVQATANEAKALVGNLKNVTDKIESNVTHLQELNVVYSNSIRNLTTESTSAEIFHAFVPKIGGSMGVLNTPHVGYLIKGNKNGDDQDDPDSTIISVEIVKIDDKDCHKFMYIDNNRDLVTMTVYLNKVNNITGHKLIERSVVSNIDTIIDKIKTFGIDISALQTAVGNNKTEQDAIAQKVEKNATAIAENKNAINDHEKRLSDVEDLVHRGLPVYGVEWDVNQTSSDVKRIGIPELHRTLPCHQLRGCLLADNGTVNGYLPQNDWTSATRDGSKGQVMVEIPEMWMKFEVDGDMRRVLLSPVAIGGFKHYQKRYVSAYEATVQRSTNKLASVVNTTEDYRGGRNDASLDDTAYTLLGKPAGGYSKSTYRIYARNRFPSVAWNMYVYDVHCQLTWLFVVEYATLNSQKTYNASLTVDGFHQGGLGSGATNMTHAEQVEFQYSPVVACGYTDSFGNNTGVKDVSVALSSGDKTFSVCRYRGVENIIGNLSALVDGLWLQTNGATIVKTEAVTFSSTMPSYSKPTCWRTMNPGYIRNIDDSAFINGWAIPKAIGGSDKTYYCDYNAINADTDELCAYLGGSKNSFSSAGLFFFGTMSSLRTDLSIGTRLCYLPQEDNSGTLRDLYISAGAKYNETTGFYELNGLTDITEEQMWVIWQEDLSGWYLKGRTNLTRNIGERGNAGGYNGGTDICNICHSNSNITKFNFGQAPFARYLDNAFSGCTKLETIDTRFPITPYGGVVGPNIFRDCLALKEVRFNMRYINYSTKVYFPASPLISKDSVLSVIETTKTEGSVKPLVVVGLNESAYNRLKDDTDITAALTEKNGFVTLIQI